MSWLREAKGDFCPEPFHYYLSYNKINNNNSNFIVRLTVLYTYAKNYLYLHNFCTVNILGHN